MLQSDARSSAAARSGFRPAARPKADFRRGGGFGGNRTATRPGSASRQRDQSLSVSTLTVSAASTRCSDTCVASVSTPHLKHREPTDVHTANDRRREPGGPRCAKLERLAREPVRPVTPVLEMIASDRPAAARGSGQAFPLPRSSWNKKVSRPTSAEGASRRSSRMEPDSALYLRSSDWQPSQFPPEPEPEPPTCVQPTGRVYVAASTEAQRARDLAEIQAKYSGSCESPGAGTAITESRQQAGNPEKQLLLCPKHREVAAERAAQGASPETSASAAGSKTRSMGFLFCGDCFALQAARRQEQAEEERQKQSQQLTSGELGMSTAAASATRQAAEARFGKSIANRMLAGND